MAELGRQGGRKNRRWKSDGAVPTCRSLKCMGGVGKSLPARFVRCDQVGDVESKMAEQKEAQKKIAWIKSPGGVIEVYANTSHILWSLDDVRIRLGQLIDSPATPNAGPDFSVAAEERVAVTFTWRNAALLRNQLSALIEAYEKVNGPIKIDVTLAPAPF